MIKFPINFKINKNLPAGRRGIALLMAVYISSIASLLGLGVFLLIYGELGISGTAKGSVVAFYAADSGLECALKWDLVNHIFATSSSAYSFPIDCTGSNSTVDFTPPSTFKVNYQVSSNSCVSITVQKFGSGQTILDSFGENVPNCAVPSSGAVQRGLNVTY